MGSPNPLFGYSMLSSPDADHVLALSVAKGGASLLADGYLVRGELGPGEAELCFGYGVFLQLLDDLQDVAADEARRSAALPLRAALERDDGGPGPVPPADV